MLSFCVHNEWFWWYQHGKIIYLCVSVTTGSHKSRLNVQNRISSATRILKLYWNYSSANKSREIYVPAGGSRKMKDTIITPHNSVINPLWVPRPRFSSDRQWWSYSRVSRINAYAHVMGSGTRPALNLCMHFYASDECESKQSPFLVRTSWNACVKATTQTNSN